MQIQSKGLKSYLSAALICYEAKWKFDDTKHNCTDET